MPEVAVRHMFEGRQTLAGPAQPLLQYGHVDLDMQPHLLAEPAQSPDPARPVGGDSFS